MDWSGFFAIFGAGMVIGGCIVALACIAGRTRRKL